MLRLTHRGEPAPRVLRSRVETDDAELESAMVWVAVAAAWDRHMEMTTMVLLRA